MITHNIVYYTSILRNTKAIVLKQVTSTEHQVRAYFGSLNPNGILRKDAKAQRKTEQKN